MKFAVPALQIFACGGQLMDALSYATLVVIIPLWQMLIRAAE